MLHGTIHFTNSSISKQSRQWNKGCYKNNRNHHTPIYKKQTNKKKITLPYYCASFQLLFFIQKLMFRRVENWCFSSYLQIRFIESILNTAGASKSPIYCKHLISSGSERLGFEQRLAGACLWLHRSDSSPAPNASALSIAYSDTFMLLSSRCHLLSRHCAEDANCVRLQDWVVSTDPDEVKKKDYEGENEICLTCIMYRELLHKEKKSLCFTGLKTVATYFDDLFDWTEKWKLAHVNM